MLHAYGFRPESCESSIPVSAERARFTCALDVHWHLSVIIALVEHNLQVGKMCSLPLCFIASPVDSYTSVDPKYELKESNCS